MSVTDMDIIVSFEIDFYECPWYTIAYMYSNSKQDLLVKVLHKHLRCNYIIAPI